MSVDAVVASAGPALPERMSRVEETLRRAASWAPGELADHALATTAARGKRLRPPRRRGKGAAPVAGVPGGGGGRARRRRGARRGRGRRRARALGDAGPR